MVCIWDRCIMCNPYAQDKDIVEGWKKIQEEIKKEKEKNINEKE